jgi:hypothetical protein
LLRRVGAFRVEPAHCQETQSEEEREHGELRDGDVNAESDRPKVLTPLLNAEARLGS